MFGLLAAGNIGRQHAQDSFLPPDLAYAEKRLLGLGVSTANCPHRLSGLNENFGQSCRRARDLAGMETHG
jgi:hypothetical protein